jgi:hypothetical protein
MATVSFTSDQYVTSAQVAWADIATGDTIVAYEISDQAGLAGAVQFAGTFGGATVTLTGSNDGTNFVTLTDQTGANISVTAAGLVEFSTACRYIKPSISGGSSDAVDVTVVLRG